MLYASDLVRAGAVFNAIVDEDIDDLPDLIASLLANSVERRLRRNLTRGYQKRESVLTRVRGRINVLSTETRQLLSRGEVYCRFEELTSNTPRNRMVRTALNLMVRVVRSDDLRQRCRALTSSLYEVGVGLGRPSRAELAQDQIGRNDSSDRFMVALARLAFDLALPTQDSGKVALFEPDREEVWVRRLFEKAVLGFARVEFEPLGWCVRGGTRLNWQISDESNGMGGILPRMLTDIVLEPPNAKRIVIDTKFTSILAPGRFDTARIKSGYLYQMYAYLRSQEGHDLLGQEAAGLLLHPAIDARVSEYAVIQSHRISVATVDLGGTSLSIRNELRRILLDQRQSLIG